MKKRTAGVAIILLLLDLGGSGIRVVAAGAKDSPVAVYERCEALEDEIKTLMGEVRRLEDEVTEAEKARANYEYVLRENEGELGRLRAWAKGG